MPSAQVTIQGVMTWAGADNSLPGQQPGVGAPVFPTNPIAPGGTTPPWGINILPHPGHGLPGVPPVPMPPIFVPPGVNVPGFPTHPIAPGGGGGNQPGVWPDQGQPSQPISGGGYIIGWSPVYGVVFIPLGGATGGSGNKPSQGGERPNQDLPGAQPGPDQGLPPSGNFPDNSLPDFAQPK